MHANIPEVVIDRLPIYARTLAHLEAEGRQVVSSQELGSELGVTPAQIRKDLSYFGRFGKQGRGYNVQRLVSELRAILGLDRQWSMALVGVGNLGRAILTYRGFAPEGFRIDHAFDSDPKVIGKTVGSVKVRDVADLRSALSKGRVEIGIVAVPGTAAQEAVDALVESGAKAILNYAPISPRVPAGVRIKDIEPVLALQSMTFFLKEMSRVTAR